MVRRTLSEAEPPGHLLQGRSLRVRAVRNGMGIVAEEEVTHDYSTLLGTDDAWKMKCNCGEPVCRGTVRNYRALPETTMLRYCRPGIIPGSILAIGD